jgi:CheY-like chemotaxis protein
MTSTGVVMVVDDDEDLRETVCELLEGDGYRTICSSDGASALSRLQEQSEKPAVILLDLMMPGMNGWEFREQQLRQPEIAHIPVVVMTASRDPSGIDANEIVFKPVKLVRLLEIVGRYAANDAGS